MTTLNRFSLSLLSILFLAVGVMGCSGANQSGGSTESMNVNETMDRIRKVGLQVTPIRSISPNFAQDGMLADTEYGDRIRIIEFQNTSNASMEVSRKSSSAGSSPYYYQKGNIMVVHLGNDSRVASALEEVFGPKKR